LIDVIAFELEKQKLGSDYWPQLAKTSKN